MNPAYLGAVLSFAVCFMTIGLTDHLALKKVRWKRTLMHSMLVVLASQLLIRLLQITERAR